MPMGAWGVGRTRINLELSNDVVVKLNGDLLLIKNGLKRIQYTKTLKNAFDKVKVCQIKMLFRLRTANFF